MKELTMIIVIVLVVIISNYLVQNYLIKTSDDIVGNLKILKEQIKKAKVNNENEEALYLVDEILKKWENIDKNWSMVVVHEELDKIKLSLLTLKATIEIGQYNDGLEEIDKSIFLVGHIKEKESFKIKNIF